MSVQVLTITTHHRRCLSALRQSITRRYLTSIKPAKNAPLATAPRSPQALSYRSPSGHYPTLSDKQQAREKRAARHCSPPKALRALRKLSASARTLFLLTRKDTKQRKERKALIQALKPLRTPRLCESSFQAGEKRTAHYSPQALSYGSPSGRYPTLSDKQQARQKRAARHCSPSGRCLTTHHRRCLTALRQGITRRYLTSSEPAKNAALATAPCSLFTTLCYLLPKSPQTTPADSNSDSIS